VTPPGPEVAPAATKLCAMTGGTAELESGFVDAGGLSLHHTYGGGGEPPVLFIHGLGSAGYLEWRFNLPHFARRRRVFAPDLPGFGRSAKPRLDYRLHLFERAMFDYATNLGLERVDLVGTSLGGRIAIDFALTHPRLVRRLVLVNSMGLGRPGFKLYYPIVALPRVGEGILRAIRRGLNRMEPARLRRVFRRLVGTGADVELSIDDRYLAELREMHASAGYHQAYLATVRALARQDGVRRASLASELAALRVPVLLAWGAEDHLFPPEIARRAHDQIPGSTLALIDGAGHTPQADRPDEFNRIVGEFLDVA
jgi:pimeloyl-ACP methyl ester carboxylesterase